MDQNTFEKAREINRKIECAKRDLANLNRGGAIEVDGINVNEYGIKKQVFTLIENAIKSEIYDLEKQFNEI